MAAVGGVTNGLIGAWGPVVTPFLLQRGLAPRFAIGSVNTAEVAVAVVASGSLLASVGGGGVDLAVVAGDAGRGSAGGAPGGVVDPLRPRPRPSAWPSEACSSSSTSAS